ncbi:MAG TPA: UDP-2,3-diacylglucosamine diphosphatase [Acidimicrobiales bacterium]|nr:UDP-2,3-diacylglucosamine diphosphatase [Acidimicrobiales bacterium]
MIIDVTAERLLVVSDLHLGSPASTAERRLVGFLDHAAEIGASVCVNGDGFDFLQSSFSRLVASSLPVLSKLRKVQAAGGEVHYVVGNHDIALEHFLSNIVLFHLAPFLNVRSGDRRIRVEHGHLYDPFYSRYPRLYGYAGRAFGMTMFVHKDFYKVWSTLTEKVDRRRRERADGVAVEFSPQHAAAEMLLQRGFDVVVFGHTHNAELVELPSGTYVNSGTWMHGGTYADIDRGEVTLRTWAEERVQIGAEP